MRNIVRRLRRPLVLLAAAAVCGGLAPLARADDGRVSLRVSNSWSRISPRELNDYLEDYVRSYEDIYGVGISRNSTKTFDWAQDFEIAVDIPLRRGLVLTASAGLLSSSREGNAFTVEWGTESDAFLRDDRIRSVAVELGLGYVMPLSGRFGLRPHFGLDAYWSTFEDSGSQTRSYSSWGDLVTAWTANAHAFNLGGTAGVTLDGNVFGGLGLFLDAGYRMARLSNFSGRYEESNEGVSDGAVDFSLLYFEETVDWLDTSYKRFNLPGGWSGGNVTLVHSAVIDLSGFYFKAGLRVSF
ncbi:MAG: hypothetical protein PHI34_10335 [Acidobacteriota bacterium]|nr:hypothetical protein [Acidobacteriota bacterium]